MELFALILGKKLSKPGFEPENLSYRAKLAAFSIIAMSNNLFS